MSFGGGGAFLTGTLLGVVVGGGGEGVGGGGVDEGEGGVGGLGILEECLEGSGAGAEGACVWGGCFGGSGRLGGFFLDLWGMGEVHTWGAFFDRESITWISFEACDLCMFTNLASSGLMEGCGGGVGLLAVALVL